MIGSIQEALKSMLYRDAKLPPSEVDIRFATPTREFTSGIGRPTVNFYLYDLQENTRLRAHDMEVRRSDTTDARRLRPRRMDLKYVVNVFFKSQLGEMDEAEWLILWRVLATLMRHAEWSDADVPEPIRALGTGVLGAVCQPDQNPRPGEVWAGVGNTARPGLHYVLTVPLDLNVEFLTPLVLGQRTTFRRSDLDDSVDRRERFGWQLRTPLGEALAGAEVRLANGLSVTSTDERGAFFLRVGAGEARHLQVRPQGEPEWADVVTVPGEFVVTLS